MNNTRRALAALFIPAFLAAATTLPVAAQDKKPAKAAEKPAEKAAVRASKTLVDNDRVRVTESVFKPGEVNPLQKRGYRVTRVLKGNTTVERTIDGKMERLEYKEGSVYVAPAGMSSLKNVGKSEVTIYTVVLKPE
jgi:quercetin dioxygenase-like cupin family protein